ncbi:DUF4892 domain-containing protein [Marinobacter sp. 2_MG-2023]|uniref:DUF4892 domain-containing protein n=1 Tax=Marinobacter sp. 2_MG-2023 TaxID=3062679 RepID=UPI0026E37C47|nr:DUF4892 domain-containing protein [Marinobacter sp. 2_MG-2023]MDO6442462.1 DUF4892 domain-containing protein [Marinobacter sp. 2_MG-2023]
MSNTLPKSVVFRFLAVVLLSTGSAFASASLPETLPEAFAQSTLETTASIESSGHLVLFSPVREINNEIRSESMARLPVSGEGQLYQIARDSSRREAREHYLGLLRDRGAKILFDCSGIRCGRSNVWANQVFSQSVLYGRDATQDYLVAGQVADDGSRWLTSVYTVTRGNLREYVWVEHLKVAAGATVPGLGSVNNRIVGPVVVPWQGGVTYRFDWQATDRRRINDLARTEGARVVLVGYSELAADESFSDAMGRARKATESLSEVLAKTGVSRQQQELLIVGPSVLVTDPARQGDRVEVMVITR